MTDVDSRKKSQVYSCLRKCSCGEVTSFDRALFGIYLQLQVRLQAAMSGRASILEAKLLIPGTQMTFLETKHDENEKQELLYCWVCARCASTPKEKSANMVRGCEPWRVDNLARHAASKQHQAALHQLGFVPRDENLPLEAPQVEQFLKVLNRKPAESLRSGVAGVGGANKVLKMLQCLAQATLRIDHDILASCASIMIHVDIRDMKLCIRFQACTEDLKIHRGVLGYETVCSNSHKEVMRGIQKALRRLCSLDGDLDDQVLDAVRARVEVLNGDGASDMQLALTELQSTGYFPNLKFTLRDKAHSARRILSRPWAAVEAINDVYQNAIAGKHSITSTIQHSGVVAHTFQEHCVTMQNAPSTARRLKNLSLAKHRFDSTEKPLSRFCLFLDAFLLTAISLAASPSQKRERGKAFLSWVNEEKILLLGLLADLSDECLLFVRVYDSEDYEASFMHHSCMAFVSKLRWLYVKGHAWELGYAAHVLEQLKTPRGFALDGQPRTIGGTGRLTAAIKQRCMESMLIYMRLAIETLEAEFPSFELLSCFHVLNVSPNVDVRAEFEEFSSALRRLSQVLELDEEQLAFEMGAHEAIARHEASQGRSTFDSWKQAVLRTSRSQRAVREHFPCDNLWELLTRYGAWSGASTSGIEQLFSRVCDHVPPDRACLTEEHLFYEVKVLADVSQANQKDVCELAQMCWALISEAPRQSCNSRIDKGVPRKRQLGTESEFKNKRRRALEQAAEIVPIATVREEVERLTDELIQADNSVLQELGFQHAKQCRNQVVAFLDGALTEADIPEGFEDVAEAFLEHRSRLQHQRALSARAYSRVMRPDAPRLESRTIFLQRGEWAGTAWAQALRLCARREDATGFVVEDASTPPERILWTVALQGGVVADLAHAESQGRQGASFTYMAAVQTRRRIFVDDDWAAAHVGLTEILLAAIEKPNSKWRLLASWEDFADASSRGGRYDTIALALPEVCRELDIPNAFSKINFLEFVTKQRVACSHFGMCGV